MKKVSAIIPTYNRFNYLMNCINSIKAQTFKNIEIIVVNDKSTEKEYYEYNWEENGIKIIHLEENTKQKFGHACAGFVRNQGIKVSSGEYIAFCDDDDIWLPMKTGVQIHEMKKNNLQMSSTDGLIGHKPYNPTKTYKLYNEEAFKKSLQNKYKKLNSNALEKGFPEIWDYNFLKIHNCMITSSVIIHKDILRKINGMNNLVNGQEDKDCWLRALKHTESIYIKEPMFYYDQSHGAGRNY